MTAASDHRVLFVTPRAPWPPRTGTHQRLLAHIEALQRMASVHIVAGAREESTGWVNQTPSLDTVDAVEREGMRAVRLWFTWLLTPTTPMAGLPSRSPNLQEAIARAVRNTSPDLLWVHRLETWSRIRPVLPRHLPTVIDADDDVVAMASQASRLPSRTTGRTAVRRLFFSAERRRYAGLVGRAKAESVLVLANPQDIRSGSRNVLCVRNGVLGPTESIPARRGTGLVVGFVGNLRYGPNADAARRLAAGLAAALKQAVPGTTVRVIGTVPAEIDVLLTASGIEVAGFVDDLNSAMSELAATIIPIERGSGTRVKAVDAMARGVPVISTPLGVAGLGLVDGETVRLASSDQDFAAAWKDLAEHPEKGDRLASAAYSHYLEELSLKAVMRDISQAAATAGVPLSE